MTAFFVLPLGLLAYVLHWNRRGWRVSAIHASIVWSCIAIASAEGLSLFHAVNRAVAIMLWISVTIATGALAWRRWRHESRRPELPTFEITPIIAAIAAIAVVTAVLAWFCAPVAWDALTYHLPRVSHWIQNGDLRHYPTHIDRQLWISPGAEYHLLHVELLNGTDRLVNFLQWAALVGCAMNASLIARLLGAGARGQRYAALFAATLSIAAVQASGAQVDLVFSFWLSASVALLLTVTSDWGNSAFWRDVLFLGAAVGLTVVAKSTAYIFGAPFVVWAVLSGVRRNPRRLAGMFAVTILCVVALSAPHSLRNLRTYGHPLHPPDHTSMFNLEVSPRVTASNVLRQTALNFGTHFGRLDTAVMVSRERTRCSVLE
ncbi:MAG: hypothetical protein H0U59_07325 [Gemmatimonadaceae bacterium]|nr:hypothetical protein [Gemmatimonadaceae bacterium]